MLNVVAVILARMSSSRLPGKVLLPIDGENSIQKIKKICLSSKTITDVVLATSDDSSDDALVDFAQSINLDSFRGSLNDVLSRFTNAALSKNADVVVYVGGDCPMLDICAVDDAVQKLVDGNFDFVTNYQPATFPNGHDVNVITIEKLKELDKKAKLKFERTNIFAFITFNMDLFNIYNVTSEINYSGYQLALDDKEDLAHLKNMFLVMNQLNVENPSISNLIDLSKRNKEFATYFEAANKNRIAKDALLSSDKILCEILAEVSSLIGAINLQSDGMKKTKMDISYAVNILNYIEKNVD